MLAAHQVILRDLGPAAGRTEVSGRGMLWGGVVGGPAQQGRTLGTHVLPPKL